jgi:hypothetical protein
LLHCLGGPGCLDAIALLNPTRDHEGSTFEHPTDAIVIDGRYPAHGEKVGTLCEAEQQPASCAYTALLADLAFLSIACGWLIQAR